MDNTRLYRLVVDAVKDPLVLARPNGAVVLTNAAADAFFNEDGRHNVSTLRRDDSPIDGGAIRDMMARHEAVRDFELVDPSGRPSGASLNVEPVRPEGGEELKLLHFRDHSPDAHREFWRDEMVAMVSHEIKNPLSAMKQSVDILLSGLPGELTEGQRRFLGTSGRSIERLTHLVEGILDVSRIQVGSFGLDRKSVDVRVFLADVIGSFKTLFNVQHVTLDWDVDDAVVDAYVDAAKLEQVMINLLSNALKHTPEGGEISVSVEPAGVEAVSDDMRLLPWKDLGTPRLLVIRVADTGLGMSSETLDNVFERHYATPGDAPGVGAHLGLNISKALIEAQGGGVQIDSKIGIGTTVSVHVPQDRTTACLLTRMAHARDVMERYTVAKRSAAFFVLGKPTDDDWDDIARTWPLQPAVNPQSRTRVGGSFHLWTINGSLAVAVLADHDKTSSIEDVFGARFVTCADGSHVLSGYAAGPRSHDRGTAGDVPGY
jgi:signal transduction histidine kinase